jgi:S-adenosylmethionine:tRNA ribosyltransferase-isomerase
VSTRLSDYDYDLPKELIAQRPAPRREDARMLVLHRAQQRIEHRRFAELKEFLLPGDLIVLNNTRVLAARRFANEGALEFLFLEQVDPRRWKALARPGKKLRVGSTVRFGGVAGTVEEICADGERIIVFEREFDPLEGGLMPLPPYIDRPNDVEDGTRYQTVFAEVPGALAAPTAGLHFTPKILRELAHAFVTLHVGLGTFRPVRAENLAEHQMHEERFLISEASARIINDATRILAVGTTVVRVLESAQRDGDRLIAQEDETNIFIYPPFEFQAVDLLLTNFHLPRSTLLMLVSAFAGREFILSAYTEAIRERYRFFSYGDCMLIL